MSATFTHLHLHTYYSLLDGANAVGALAKRVKELGMNAVAMTDHGNLFGAVEFYTKMKDAEIKPIIGCEIYLMTAGDHREKAFPKDGMLSHLTLLCENETGYRNLCKLVSRAYLEGFYYKPRINKPLLAEFSEGIICLSGCLKGEVSTLLARDQFEDAKAAAQWYANTFPGRYYIELMRHDIPDLHKVEPGLLQIAKELNLPVVATNDCHYLKCEQALAQDVLVCISTGKALADEKRMKMTVDTFYLRSPEEMAELFSDVPEAISNTMVIADRCNFKMQFGKYHFPKFEVPAGKDLNTLMCEQAREGLKERWPLICLDHAEMTPEIEKQYLDRLETELTCVQTMGFAGYFLIVADFINFAKSQDIPVGPGRGSAAGSLVAYSMKITDINPIPYNLLFERFLNPERISMPDMDIDFCMRRRDEVIDYVSRKYGNVGQIVTFGKMKAKAAIRDVGRVMGLPYGDVDRIAKLVPNTLNITLEEALEVEPRLRDLGKKDEQVGRLLEIAQTIEGFPRHASTHAAGVVISDQPLENFVPLSRGQQGEVVTQFDMKGVEKVGLIKFDFLGLKTLTVIDDALKLIQQTRGEKIDLAKIAMSDAATYRDLGQGSTRGVFQLESSGMTDLVMKLKPTCFSDIIALVALFRPGPLGSGMVDDFINRKHGRTEIKYDLPELEPILSDTYGVIVYQEQVMQVASRLANYTMGESDLLRRAMGKKNTAEMAQQKLRFMDGCRSNKLDPKISESIFELLFKFSDYGFNKCVVGETEVIDARTGEMNTVGELYSNRKSIDTVSLEQNHKLSQQPVTDVIFNGLKPVFEVTTHLGHRITITDNHPLLTVQGWKELKELQVGSRIAAPRALPCPVVAAQWVDHEVATLGWLISEGNLCHPTSVYFYNNDPVAIDDFVDVATRFPLSVARTYVRDDGRFDVCVNTGSRSKLPTKSTSWTTGNIALDVRDLPKRSGLYQWCDRHGLLNVKADAKRLPDDVFMFDKEQLALLLGRMWSGDGFISSEKLFVPFYATSSEVLARQVVHLLLRLGMVGRLAKKRFKYRGGHRLGYTVHLTGKGTVQNFIHHIVPHIVGRYDAVLRLRDYIDAVKKDQESRDTIPSEIKSHIQKLREQSGLRWTDVEDQSGVCVKELYGEVKPHKKGFRAETIQTLGEFFNDAELLNLASSDIYWDEIVSIESKGVQKTYDLTVESTHNFVANNLIVHNSHSAAYALVSYHTAYLKTHYPTEYMAAVMTNEMLNTDKILVYMNDCKEMGIEVLPPDVNESVAAFSVVGERKIRFGLTAVKNVGEGAIESIIQTRNENGRFESLSDFCERVDMRRANRRVVESLIKCGAFDGIRKERHQLMQALDMVLQRASSLQKEKASGQESIFDMLGGSGGKSEDPVDMSAPPWPEKILLDYEKESLGFYLSGHPLTEYQALLKTYATHTTATLQELEGKRDVRIGGVVSTLKEITTKKGDRMAFIGLEDLTGTIEVVVFSDVYAAGVERIKDGRPLLVTGTAEPGEEMVKLLATDIIYLDEVTLRLTKSIHFHINADLSHAQNLETLKGILAQYKGECPAFLHLVIPNQSETVMALPRSMGVLPSRDLMQSVNALFGDAVTEFLAAAIVPKQAEPRYPRKPGNY